MQTFLPTVTIILSYVFIAWEWAVLLEWGWGYFGASFLSKKLLRLKMTLILQIIIGNQRLCLL